MTKSGILYANPRCISIGTSLRSSTNPRFDQFNNILIKIHRGLAYRIPDSVTNLFILSYERQRVQDHTIILFTKHTKKMSINLAKKEAKTD